ncbi:unnamed protein product [Effrenium voratum]|nr:unnamed protein product [Effrenium voratum]
MAETLGMVDASFDERARYHATRFREKRAAAVLHRYELQRTQMSRPQLEKHACHVASWLVALPRDKITQDHNGLSVVTLFVRYLESVDGPSDRPVGARLARILARVSQTILCVLGDDPVGLQLQKQISKHMPPQELVPADCSLGEENREECEDAEAKAARLMQRAIQRWQNSDTDSRETYVNGLEEELAESQDPATLRRILRRAVAALSPPRCKGDRNSMLAYSSSQSGLPASKDLQARLRSLVLACLDSLDLTDSAVAPALQRLQAHVQTFQELLVSQSSVASQKQWLRVQAKCAATAEALQGPSACSTSLCVDGNERKRKHPECPHGMAKENCKQCSACPHGKAKKNCKQCKGCLHGMLERRCAQCHGCKHGKLKFHCRLCSPCPHGKVKADCPQCHPCQHGRVKRKCKQCKGLKG